MIYSKKITTLIDVASKLSTDNHAVNKIMEMVNQLDSYEFELLKLILESPDFPVAVEPSLICDENIEEDKNDRAKAIIEIFLNANIENASFLDFGCGEGYVVKEAWEHGADVAFGYDLLPHSWVSSCTMDFSIIKENSPYDIILAYDIIDHVTPPDFYIKQMKDLLAPKGEIHARCHPWCSRHASHLYKCFNKAYAHLIFTEEELQNMGCFNKFTQRVIHPVNYYEKLFKGAGFHIKSRSIIRELIPPIIMNNKLIRNRIINHWAGSHEDKLRTGKKFPKDQLEQQFHDYVLIHA